MSSLLDDLARRRDAWLSDYESAAPDYDMGAYTEFCLFSDAITALAEAAAHKAEAGKLRASLEVIAEIAHAGGLKEMGEGAALISIRRATLPYWTSPAAIPTAKEAES